MTEKRVDCPAFQIKSILGRFSNQAHFKHLPSDITHLTWLDFPVPSLLLDGDCGFCRYWVNRWKARSGDRIEFLPYQEASDRFPFLREKDLAEAVHPVEVDGSVLLGAAAVFRTREVGINGAGWHFPTGNTRGLPRAPSGSDPNWCAKPAFFLLSNRLIDGRNKG